MKYRALIVDDEPLARERLRTLLAADPEVDVVAECANGREAIAAVARYSPDLLFLDVQMPEVSGFGVLEAIGADTVPAVVFVTAYDDYALKAFEVHALDYLLKPFDRERFQKSLDRVKRQLKKGGDLPPKLTALLEDWKKRPADRLVLKDAGRVYFLKVDEIDWIEAEGNYVRLHTGAESHMLRETMSRIEARLDARKFIRIHRSAIVNVDCIKELRPFFRGEYVVVLRSGRKLTLTRGYRPRLEEILRS